VAASAWRTNKSPSGAMLPSDAELRIMSVSPTPNGALRSADEAATQLSGLVRRQYGVSAVVLQDTNTGRWLLPHELTLRIGRFWKR
jgi:hypothetical protein